MSVALLTSAAGIRLADLDEPALVRRAVAGDRDAFGELYQQHRASVLRFLRSQLGRFSPDIEDVAADAFITALTKIDRFSLDESGRFVNWLLSIARFTACHHRRYRATHPETELREWGDSNPIDDRVLDPEQVIVDRFDVQAMLARLSPAQRRAVVLQYAADMSGDQVAYSMGITHKALWKLTEQARTSLRQQHATRKRHPKRVSATLPSALCACGCGVELPAVRKHNQRFATDACRQRINAEARRRRSRIPAKDSAATDPALERVLGTIVAAGSTGIARKPLAKRTNLTAARLDAITEQLVRRRLISRALEPSVTRPVTRYRTLAGAAARRAA